jgi:hypothetical protein
MNMTLRAAKKNLKCSGSKLPNFWLYKQPAKKLEPDKTPNVVEFAQKLDKASLESVISGIMTGVFAFDFLKTHFGYKKA